MTREELEKEAIAKYKMGSYPQLHPDHYAFIHGYLAGAEPREERIAALDKENGKLEGKLSDLQSEYIELENFHNNEVKGLKDILERVESENIRLINRLAFTENTLNNRTAQIEELEKALSVCNVSNSFNKEQLTKAKDIITNLVNFDSSYKNDEEYQYKSMLHDEIWEEAEQFLKEANK